MSLHTIEICANDTVKGCITQNLKTENLERGSIGEVATNKNLCCLYKKASNNTLLPNFCLCIALLSYSKKKASKKAL